MALRECHHGRQRVGSAAPSQSRRRDDVGMLADREVHDGWLVRPRLRWKPEEMHIAYLKRRDNLYRDKSPLPHPLACWPLAFQPKLRVSTALLKASDRLVSPYHCHAGHRQPCSA